MSEHHTRKLRLAVIGFGRLGRACATNIRESSDLALSGVVRRPEAADKPLPEPFRDVRSVSHISDLGQIDAALICVPADDVLGVARELLQARIPIVECASLEGDRFEAHREELNRLANHHRVPAMLGAGWESGMVSRLQRLFELLIPKGQTTLINRPGISLHHTTAAQGIKDVRGALCTELRAADGELQRYVYVELERNADLEQVRRAIEADPLFLGEKTFVFEMESIAALEEEGHGILIERHGAGGAGMHDALLLEARFTAANFAARIMLDAARQLASCRPGARVYQLSV